METYNKMTAQFDRITFGLGSTALVMLIFHMFSCRYIYLINTLSMVKVTYIFLRLIFGGTETWKDTMKRFLMFFIIGSACLMELFYKDEIEHYHHILFFDTLITFIFPLQYYFEFVNDHIQIGGLLDFAYIIQSIICSLCVWKTYDPLTKDPLVPFCIGYVASPLYFLVLFVYEAYIKK